MILCPRTVSPPTVSVEGAQDGICVDVRLMGPLPVGKLGADGVISACGADRRGQDGAELSPQRLRDVTPGRGGVWRCPGLISMLMVTLRHQVQQRPVASLNEEPLMVTRVYPACTASRAISPDQEAPL